MNKRTGKAAPTYLEVRKAKRNYSYLHTHRGGRCSRAKEARLARMFRDLNREFFHGAIRGVRVFLGEVAASPLDPVHPDNGGECMGDAIIIDWRFGRRSVNMWWRIREILLHEMCHVGPGERGVYPHGHPVWMRRMYRLGRKGEVFALSDLLELVCGLDEAEAEDTADLMNELQRRPEGRREWRRLSTRIAQTAEEWRRMMRPSREMDPELEKLFGPIRKDGKRRH